MYSEVVVKLLLKTSILEELFTEEEQVICLMFTKTTHAVSVYGIW